MVSNLKEKQMPRVNRHYTGTEKSHVQSVRFKKDSWTEAEAKNWCKDHDYFVDGFDDSETEYRFRQYDPNSDKFRYMAKESGKAGLYFILGFKK